MLLKYRDEHKRIVHKLNIPEFAGLDFSLIIHVVVSLRWSPQLGKMCFVVGFGLVWTPDKPNQITLELQNGLKVIYRTPSLASIRILFSQPSGIKSSYCCTHMSFSVQMYQCKTNFLLLTGCTQSTVKEQD